MADIVIQPRGAAGANGLNLYTEFTNPTPSDGRDNETWLNVRTFTMFKKVQGTWTAIASLAPPAPKPGTPGAPGKTIYSDEGPPSPQLGTTGDFYIQKMGGGVGLYIYGPKAGAVWPDPVALVTLLVGNAPPVDNYGVNGQVYIDVVGLKLYGPKLNGEWPAGVPIVGVTALQPVAPWQTATAYTSIPPASFVSKDGSSYQCLVSHTSGAFATDLANGFWGLIAAKGVDGGGVVPSPADGQDVAEGSDGTKYVTAEALADATAIVSSSGSGVWNPDLATGVNLQRIATGPSTLGPPENAIEGRTYTFLLTQDATGGRTWNFNIVYKFSAGDPIPSTGPNKTDLVFAFCISPTNFRCHFDKSP